MSQKCLAGCRPNGAERNRKNSEHKVNNEVHVELWGGGFWFLNAPEFESVTPVAIL